MAGVGRWAVLVLGIVSGCTGNSEPVREAQARMQTFNQLRAETRRLFETRAQVELKRQLFNVRNQDDDALPPALRQARSLMRAKGVELNAEDIERDEAALRQRIDEVFGAHEGVLLGEIVIIDPDQTVTLQYPQNVSPPVVAKWAGLREQRMFCAIAECRAGDARQPCVVIQLRPRGYPGSAGLTVGFRLQ